jgi:hypothetical protein
MFGWLIDLAIDGCTHGSTTRVFTDTVTKASHITCLDCGAELPYDWQQMRRIPRREQLGQEEQIAECRR